jgi:fructose-1,6-bisphosphatase/inositol monophosphatase family enzyme
VAAGALLIGEAGGRAGAIEGNALDIAAGSILASNGRIHAEMERVLGEVGSGAA